MRSYYDAGIPSPSAAFEESFRIMFERVTKTSEWEMTKARIEEAIKKGFLKCESFFSITTRKKSDIEELKIVLKHLGYSVFDKDYSNGISLLIDWNQDYGKYI